MLGGQQAPGLTYLCLSVLGFHTHATMFDFTWMMGITLGFLMLAGQKCGTRAISPGLTADLSMDLNKWLLELGRICEVL